MQLSRTCKIFLSGTQYGPKLEIPEEWMRGGGGKPLLPGRVLDGWMVQMES